MNEEQIETFHYISKLLQEFCECSDLINNNEFDEKTIRSVCDDNNQCSEFCSLDFIKAVVNSNYNSPNFTIKPASKFEKNDDLFKYYMGDIDLKQIITKIPRIIGERKLMFYQMICIYQIVYGTICPNIGLHCNLKEKILKNVDNHSSQYMNLLPSLADFIMYPEKQKLRFRHVVLNMTTGVGKTLTSIYTAVQAMCDDHFLKEAMLPENVSQWYNDHNNATKGVIFESSVQIPKEILPVTVINVPNDSLFLQWHEVLQSEIENMIKYASLICNQQGKNPSIKVEIYPKSVESSLTLSLSSIPLNEKDELTLTFVITKDTNVLNFLESETNNSYKYKTETFEQGHKKRKILIEVTTPSKLQCPAVFINDESHESKSREKYSKIKAPIMMHLCSTIQKVIVKETSFAKIIRNNVPFDKANNHFQQRDTLAQIMNCSVLSRQLQQLACYEASSKGHMPKSIIINKNNEIKKITYRNMEPAMPRQLYDKQEIMKYANRQKLYDSINETLQSSKFLEMKYSKNKYNYNFSFYCGKCKKMKQIDNSTLDSFYICKTCYAIGFCSDCKDTSSLHHCSCCDAPVEHYLKLYEELLGINDLVIPKERIIADEEELTDEDMKFYFEFSRDLRNVESSSLFMMNEKENRNLIIEKNIKFIKDKISMINGFPLEVILYLNLQIFALGNYRHIVLLTENVDDVLKYVKYTPFKEYHVFDGRKKENVLVQLQKCPIEDYFLLVMPISQASFGVDFKNVDAIISFNNASIIIEQIAGRLMRIGMDYRARFIVTYNPLEFNLQHFCDLIL
jgi:hypothetical protein